MSVERAPSQTSLRRLLLVFHMRDQYIAIDIAGEMTLYTFQHLEMISPFEGKPHCMPHVSAGRCVSDCIVACLLVLIFAASANAQTESFEK